MADTRQVSKLCSVILDESLSATQQFLALFKYVSHHGLIEQIKIAGLIVQSKEIKVAVFNQTNTILIVNEALRTKNIQGRVTDEKRSIAITNMNVCSNSNIQQSNSCYPSDLDQIKAMVVTISIQYRWKYEFIKKKSATRR